MRLTGASNMQKKLIFNYASLLIGLLALPCGFVYYINKLNTFEESNYLVDHTHQVIQVCDRLEKEINYIEIGYRAFLATKDSSFLKPYFAGIDSISDIFIRINYLTKDDPVQQTLIDSLHNMASVRLAYMINKSQVTEGPELNKVLHGGETYLAELNLLLAQIRANEVRLLNQRRIVKKEVNKEAKISSFSFQIVAFIICCVTSWGLVFYLNKNIQYQKELEESNTKLILINDELNQLAMVATHNLQEPMRKMQLIVDRLQHQIGVDIDQQLNESLLTIKRIYQKQQELNNSIVDYFEILTSTEESKDINLHYRITELAAQKKWDINLVLEVSSTVQMGEHNFRVLTENIIRNSIANKDPQRDLEIRIHESENKEYIIVAFSDNGKINTTDEANKLLDSIGTGLSLCRRIMLNHNGYILTKPGDKEGITILLFFPKQKKKSINFFRNSP